MRVFPLLLIVITLGACRGEPVPRDYQNHPPTMTNPPATQSETPAGHGMGQAPPQPSTGVEGTTGPYEPVTPGADQTTTISDTPPVTTTT
ncbi:MAG TPA: hypothetical protein VF057_14460 [Thermoanaerobaculia bacterium]